MEHSKVMLQEMLVMVMRLVNESWPDEAAYIVGMAMGQIVQDREGQESRPEQPPGEWRTHQVDGYHFSIRRTDSGLQREPK